MTFKELKEFLNSLNDVQLEHTAQVEICEQKSIVIKSANQGKEDIYTNIGELEDCGTLDELKEFRSDEFNEDDYELSIQAGTPYLES